MRLSIPSIYLPSFLLFFLLPTPTSATKKSYVVYLGAHSHRPEQSPIDFNRVTETHYEFLASFLGSHALAKESILYSYARHINGFAATFDDEVAASIAKHPKVISVFLNKGRKLHTTRSWDFLGLEHDGVIASNSSWKKARYGEDTIIGNLDTGVWPESKSFSDEGMGPIPSKWKGICQNETDAGFHCNRVGNEIVLRRDYGGAIKIAEETLATKEGNELSFPDMVIITGKFGDSNGWGVDK